MVCVRKLCKNNPLRVNVGMVRFWGDRFAQELSDRRSIEADAAFTRNSR
jgi:hypothetical protein